MSNNLPELLKKYLKGECSKEEETVLFAWYYSFEDHKDPFDSLTDAQVQEVKERMLGRVRENIAPNKEKRMIGIPAIWYWLSGTAAMLLVVLALFQYNRQKTQINSELITVNNLSQSIHKIMLADSSVVWLGPQSKLQYPHSFDGGSRTVNMKGEAFFEVTRDPKNPFIINSGNVITKVLGTSFRIKSYEGSNSTEVSVMTGKVSVSIPAKDDEEVMILPSHKITYLQDKQLLKEDIEEKTSSMRIWEKTTMTFENVPVSNVIAKLNKKFGVSISSDDLEIDEYELNADFTDQSLPEILQILEKSLNITYTINDKEITLNKKI